MQIYMTTAGKGLKHISFTTDWVQCHLLMENYIRAEAMA